MITYNECLAEVGFFELGDAPTPINEYLAYKNGEVRHFGAEQEAKEFSHLLEFVTKNNDEINTYWTKLRLLEQKGIQLFIERVREEYAAGMSKKLWELCWSAAYKRSHGDGYDEVANSAKHYIDFANEVLMIHTDSGKKMNMMYDNELKTIYKQRDNIVSPKY